MAGIDGARRRPEELGLGLPGGFLGESKRERSEAIESEMGTSSRFLSARASRQGGGGSAASASSFWREEEEEKGKEVFAENPLGFQEITETV